MSKLIHPELSYTVRGVLLDVHNTLGPGLKEAYYRDAIARDAIALGLEARGVPSQVEKGFEVYYEVRCTCKCNAPDAERSQALNKLREPSRTPELVRGGAGPSTS